jgi:ribonuclease HI
MSASAVLTIHTDGAARGNPGPAAFAYVITRAGAPPIEEAECLGRATNNQAEYTALVRALEHAARLGTHHRLIIMSDSELLVKQMNGEYKVKDNDLRVLYEQAHRLRDRFPSVTIRHVRRAENSRADKLCNEALDGRRRSTVVPTGKAHAPKPVAHSAHQEAARAEVVACLSAVAKAWAHGNPNDPTPETVCDQLWSILEEHGIVRRPSAR